MSITQVIQLLFLVPIILNPIFGDWRGQVSTLGNIHKKSSGYDSHIGIQYVPTWSLVVPWPTALFDTEFSLNINSQFNLKNNNENPIDFNLETYRLWLRRSTDVLDIRVGLQKITFGPARLLRSLRWFDHIDPTDPLQLTEGVWGIRAIRYFENNSNIWLWGLFGNSDTKGWEIIPTKKNNLEFGGRFQTQIGNSEIGLSAHNRIVSRRDLPEFLEINTMANATNEFRVAIDGYYDIGAGLWFEATYTHTDFGIDHPNWQALFTVGSDYTLSIGNGLTIIAEHFMYNLADKPSHVNNDLHLSAFMAAYQVSILDRFSTIFFYNWDSDLPYVYLSWHRTYDNWTFNLNSFYSSKNASQENYYRSITDFSSRGVQVMLIYHH